MPYRSFIGVLMKISEIMTPCPYHIDPTTTIDSALEIMGINQIRHLPVVENGSLVGVLTERHAQIAQMVSGTERQLPCASDICTDEPMVVLEDALVADVAHEMAETKSDCTLVANNEGDLVGIFTTTDACRLIHLMLDQPTS